MASASEATTPGSAPTRCIPVSTLRCTGTGGDPGAGHGPSEGLDSSGGVDRRDQTAGHRLGHPLQRRLGQQEHGRLDAGLPEGHPLLHQGHGEPGCTSFEGGPGDGNVAVPVAVGLHHPAEGRRADEPAQHGGVVPYRVEVDVGPGRPPALSHGIGAGGRRPAFGGAAAPARPPGIEGSELGHHHRHQIG